MAMSWLSPHPDMMVAPAPSGNGMLKIIRDGGAFTLYRQTNAGLETISVYPTAADAKQAALNA